MDGESRRLGGSLGPQLVVVWGRPKGEADERGGGGIGIFTRKKLGSIAQAGEYEVHHHPCAIGRRKSGPDPKG